MRPFIRYTRAKGAAHVGVIRLVAFVASLSFVLAACGNGTSSAPTEDDGTDEAAADESPSTLRIATQDEGSSWHAYGATLAELLRDEIDPSVQVLPVGGAGANSTLVQNGDAELMINFSNISRWSYDGTVVFDEPHDSLRGLVGGMDQYYVGIVARDGLDIETLADVKDNEMGIRLFTLPVGSGGEATTRLLLESYGFGYDEIDSWGGQVEHTSFDVIKSAFRDGRADVMVHTITASHPATTEIAQTTDVKLIPILEDEVLSELADEYSMPPVELPGESYRGQREAVQTAGLVSVLGASANLPEDLVYTITKSVLESRDTLVQAHPSLEPLSPDTAAQPELLGIPLHEGAERYYDEEGLLPE